MQIFPILGVMTKSWVTCIRYLFVSYIDATLDVIDILVVIITVCFVSHTIMIDSVEPEKSVLKVQEKFHLEVTKHWCGIFHGNVGFMRDEGMEVIFDSLQHVLVMFSFFLHITHIVVMQLDDEEAGKLFQSLITDSVNALFPQLTETIHRWAQVWRNLCDCTEYLLQYCFLRHCVLYSSSSSVALICVS